MKVDVKHLANLALIDLKDEEARQFESEFAHILDFVSKVSEIDLDLKPELGDIYNVFRSDDEEHNFDFNKESLVKSAPKNDGKYILVKKVIKK